MKIDKDIPIPLPKGGRNSEFATLLKSMEVGDSFHSQMLITSLRQAVHRHLGSGNYAIRNEGNGARVWRTK